MSFALTAVASAVVVSATLYFAVRMVRSGRGLEPYPVSVDDFNWIGLLVLIGVVPVAILVGLVFCVLEYREWRSLERKYPTRGGVGGADAIVEAWREPARMDSGAPEPVLVRDGDGAWVAYRADDPDFPGWDHASVTEYLAAHPGEPFGVLRFDGVVACRLGPPSDERLHEHPLHAGGLDLYAFHRVKSREGTGHRWIVTFHDQTLDVMAREARAFPLQFAASGEEAITRAKRAG